MDDCRCRDALPLLPALAEDLAVGGGRRPDRDLAWLRPRRPCDDPLPEHREDLDSAA